MIIYSYYMALHEPKLQKYFRWTITQELPYYIHAYIMIYKNMYYITMDGRDKRINKIPIKKKNDNLIDV